ncbi:MAG: MFS transporter [Clostridia bacterium]|nr:MFS transporter [Clostridia bacterium]
MRQKPVTTARYAVLQSSYWLTLCTVAPFASVFLLDHGFTSAQVGMIMAWANLLAMLVQPLVGAFADRSRKVFLSQLMAAFAALGLLLAAGMLLPLPRVLLGGMFLLSVSAVMINQPLVNAICIYYTDRGVDVNFGVARGIGSGVYAIASWVLGVLVNRFGSCVLLISGIALCALLIVLALGYRPIDAAPERAAGASRKEGPASTSIRGFGKKYPKFMLLLAGCVLLFVFHTYSTTYFYQIVLSIGGNSADMGLSNALAALVELPAMFLFGRMARRWSCEKLLMTAAIAYVVKSVAFFLAPNMPWMNVAQCFQALSYAVYVPATIHIANQMMDVNDQNKGQTLLTAANALAAIVGGLTGGVLIDRFGASQMLLVGMGCTVLGAATIFVSAGRSRSNLGASDR